MFFPYVALYLGAAFLQGGAGTGSNGLLNNLRSWLWIPISQSAYRTIALDLFSHVLDLDLKFHLMCVARAPACHADAVCRVDGRSQRGIFVTSCKVPNMCFARTLSVKGWPAACIALGAQ